MKIYYTYPKKHRYFDDDDGDNDNDDDDDDDDYDDDDDDDDDCNRGVMRCVVIGRR